MKATLSLIVLMTFILGVVLIGSAMAQPSDGGPAAEEAAPEAPPVEAEVGPPTEEAALEAAPLPEKPLGQSKALYKSVKGGEWLLAFGFLGMLLGSIARYALGKQWAFLKSKSGGYTIAAFTGMGSLGGLIIEAGTFSLSMLPTAFTVMLAAMALHGPAKAVTGKLKGTTEA